MSNQRRISWWLFGGVAFALLALMLAAPTPMLAQISVGVGIHIAPPVLPVYAQPICPGPNYIWTPGYWAYDSVDGYYWVPGTWVLAPEAGLLWTPGYWGWGDGVYLWHAGYWGPHVGFYGGINYGFGYAGVGYAGGYWDRGAFRYNTAVNHVNVNVIHNTYDRAVPRGATVSHASFNGGQGGVNARPTAAEDTAARERHVQATGAQVQNREAASKDRGQFASVNHGRPAVAETAKPGEFGHGAAAAAPVPVRSAGNAGSEKRNAGVAASKQPAHNVESSNRSASVRTNRAPVESSRRSAENNTLASGNARFNAKPESNPRGNFERPAETPRANPAPRESRPAAAPRESAPARAPQPHAAPQVHEQARAGEAPRGNERHDGK